MKSQHFGFWTLVTKMVDLGSILGGWGAVFFVRWISVENGMEIVIEVFNYLATVNTALGSSVSFFIAFV